MMAKGIIPYNNKYSLWTIGIPQKDYQNKVLDMADLVIAVGYDIVEFAPGKWNGEGKHKIIHTQKRSRKNFSNCGKKWWRNMKAMQMPPLFP